MQQKARQEKDKSHPQSSRWHENSCSARDVHNHESDRHAHFRAIDPQLLSSYGTGDVAILGRDIIYRSVYLFIEHIQDAVASGGKAVQNNLSTRLRGSVM